jgi:hypothetical protein
MFRICYNYEKCDSTQEGRPPRGVRGKQPKMINKNVRRGDPYLHFIKRNYRRGNKCT